MSGHSKWSTIKRKKGAQDARRGKVFSKLIREIYTAARLGGGDPDANPRLRQAIEKAQGQNMPKENIERAIERGTGGGETQYDEVVYEGYGPRGVAVLVEGLTDNRNRTVSEVRKAFKSGGGTLGDPGCVSFLFERRGLLRFERGAGVDADALMEAALEVGAEDLRERDGALEVVAAPSSFEAVRAGLAERGFPCASAEITMEPVTTVPLEGEDAKRMLQLADALEELDDVQAVYANYDIPDEAMAQLA